MVKRRILFGILLTISLLTILIGGKGTKPLPRAGSEDVSAVSFFIAGGLPASEAQASYLVAVPAAASMETPSRGGIAEASESLSEGLNLVFRYVRLRFPVPSDAGKRRLLLKVLRI